MALVAVTREVPETITYCQLTHIAREPIDLGRAREQHRTYERALAECGYSVTRLEEDPGFPDSVFIEDTTLVLDEVAVITRPGAESRRGEVETVADVIASWRKVVRMTTPATLDGGDVLRLGRTLYVGVSRRSNADGVAQLRELTRQFGYSVRAVEISDALHLKTAVTQLSPDHIVVNPRWVDASLFEGYTAIEVDPTEPFAANALMAGGRVILSTAFPRTADKLEGRGISVLGIDASELAKAEGGVTCCSVLFEV